ncbi:unnamed protein product [Paramecium pentaurelia]|uniref:Uncharacterized protein n=1 Tax=Paramecium pentaurelia TaxID=43138 RepID=A0A8S1X316_9CILI|nr:unnamed protein product [Paramecium pentaurelia]
MFQQHNNTISTSRSNSSINQTPRRLIRVATPSGIDKTSAIKKNEEFHNQQIDLYKQRESHYKKIIFAKDQEISMMKSHIQQLEENINQNNLSNQIQKQIQDLTQQVQILLESYNQRILEIENLKKSQGHDHTELERQVLQLLRENSQLMNSLTVSHTYQDIQSKKNSLQNISKIHPTETSWKQKFIKLNKEYYELQEKYAYLTAELDNNRFNFRSPSLESFEAIIRQ